MRQFQPFHTQFLHHINQQRKDAIKSELDSKFHSLCEPAYPVSATQLLGDNLNAELKELYDSKKVSIAKKMFLIQSSVE